MVSIAHPTHFKLCTMCDLTKNELDYKLVFFGGKILQLGKKNSKTEFFLGLCFWIFLHFMKQK